MEVTATDKLDDFGKQHPDAKKKLATWLKVVEKATWRKWADVKVTYAAASIYRCCIVFNIGSYRLIVRRRDWKSLYVLGVYTHEEYDKNKWKASCEG
jgi:mRNA interferase HigB